MNNKRHRVERRANRPQPIGRLIDRALSKPMRRNGFAHSEVLTRWSAIVGPELASASCPEKLSYAPHNHGAGTLSIRVTGAAALEFQHREPQIIERVNAYFGFRAVSRIRLIQGSLPTSDDRPDARPIEPPAGKSSGRPRSTIGVADERLRDALDRLGQQIDSTDPLPAK